jgi:hypothetical protein
MANPFPFVASTVLEAAQLNGIGEYAAYTPTFAGLTIGNGTLDWRFGRVQNLIHVEGKLTFGSTTSVSGNVTFTLPVTARSAVNNIQIGVSRLGDAGVGTVFGLVAQSTTTTASVLAYNAASTYLGSTAFTSTVPFTWNVNDEIYVNCVYEAA